MADDAWQALVERTAGGDVTPGSMFGCRGLRTGRRFFARWWDERLVVKRPAQRLQDLVAAGRAQAFEPLEGRRMNGWAVAGGTLDWDELVEEARAWTTSQR